MKHPLISIGMPVFNCERTISAAIASILNQSFKDWQLLVYDDGSTDATVAKAKEFTDPRICILEGKENYGLPASLNIIISQCKSEYFARMDGDDIAYPDRLRSQLEFLQTHPDTDLVAGSILIFHGDGTPLGLRRSPEFHQQICAKPYSGIAMAHATWMGKTTWFQCNPYNPSLRRAEDWELLFRTHRYSSFANVNNVLLGVREDSLSLRKIYASRVHICTSMMELLLRGESPWRAAFAILGQCARLIIEFATILLGLKYLFLKHRIPPANSEDVAEWHSVYTATVETVAATAMRSHGATA